jgi:hypothetical protein
MLENVLALMAQWKPVFAQERTAHRAMRQALSSACAIGRRTIARSLAVREPVEGEGEDWSAEYRLHARSAWAEQDLFTPALRAAVAMCPGPLVPLATDDTRLPKSGKTIPTAYRGRDPMSPPFHVNLTWGVRFLHTSVLVPLHTTDAVAARAVPVWFENTPPVKKPGRRATELERAAYREAIKTKNLSVEAVEMFGELRRRVDEVGGQAKRLVFAVDASFTNRTTFRAPLERTVLIGRTRKDAKLCWPASEGGRRVYEAETFTPESVMSDAGVVWKTAEIFHGGRVRQIEYKELVGVLWRRGAATRPLRLVVVKPVPYRVTKAGRVMFRDPAFLLCTEVEGDVEPYLQIYFDRLHIEVAHREVKDTFGVGQAQVRSPKSVSRQPVLSMATYSLLHIAALQAYGARRAACFGPLPKWQREKTRASCQDLIRHLRNEVVDKPHLVAFLDLKLSAQSLMAAAAA